MRSPITRAFHIFVKHTKKLHCQFYPILLIIDSINITINVITHCISMLCFNILFLVSWGIIMYPWNLGFNTCIGRNVYILLPFELPIVSLKNRFIWFCITLFLPLFLWYQGKNSPPLSASYNFNFLRKEIQWSYNFVIPPNYTFLPAKYLARLV